MRLQFCELAFSLLILCLSAEAASDSLKATARELAKHTIEEPWPTNDVAFEKAKQLPSELNEILRGDFYVIAYNGAAGIAYKDESRVLIVQGKNIHLNGNYNNFIVYKSRGRDFNEDDTRRNVNQYKTKISEHFYSPDFPLTSYATELLGTSGTGLVFLFPKKGDKVDPIAWAGTQTNKKRHIDSGVAFKEGTSRPWCYILAFGN